MARFLDNSCFWEDFYIEYLRESSYSLKHPGYYTQYKLWKFFLKRTFPFYTIKPGDTAIQVGNASWTFNAGISQTAMLSSLVGSKGKVLVIEPEDINITDLKHYCEKYSINNIEIMKSCLWSRSGLLDFVINETSSGAHVLREVLVQRGRTEIPSSIQLEVKTLSEISECLPPFPKFINITVNGGEFEILQGAQELLKKNVDISFPIFGPREWYQKAFDLLSDYKYHIVISNAPPTLRGAANLEKRALKKKSEFPKRYVALATKSLENIPKKRLTKLTNISKSNGELVIQ